MNIVQWLLGRFENKGIHKAKNEATPELLRIQYSAKVAVRKAEDSVHHTQRLKQQSAHGLVAYRVALATRRIDTPSQRKEEEK